MRHEERWNLNIHCHRAILDVAPEAGSLALDVGSGDGLLAFDLADRGLHVIGIDPDAPSVDRAKGDSRASARTDFVCGDLLTHEFAPASFDLVASVAMLHHVDAVEALRSMRKLVRPGGTLAIVGFARPSDVRDRLLMVAGTILVRFKKARGVYWEHHAPIVWPPPLTMREMRAVAEAELPGARLRSLMLNRYSLVWTAPVEAVP